MNIIHGDALTVLRTLGSASINCCVTSPPYYKLRDYGVAGQIGLEKTPQAYIGRLVEVFREVKRVLSDDGTLWVNMGDSYYAGSGKSSGQESMLGGEKQRSSNGLKPKDLIGIPWMLAFALRDDGWYLRQDIIWAKPNPMPESVRDRCTRSHEYIFLLSKSKRYYYDAEAIKEPGTFLGPNGQQKSPHAQGFYRRTREQEIERRDKQRGHSRRHAGFNDRWDAMKRAEQCSVMRNKRDVWTISTQPTPEAHFATFPLEIPETCLKAGCPEGGTVLDPFAGAGTTGLACLKHGRQFVGIELNQEYIDIARSRAMKTMPLLSMEVPA